MTFRKTAVGAVAGGILLLAGGSTALAQAQAPARPPAAGSQTPGRNRGVQLAITGAITTPRAFDPAAVTFLTPAGEPLVISRSQTRIGLGFGVDLHLSMRATSTVDIEASGSWMRAPYRTEVTFDVEDGQLLTAGTTASQFGVEGAAVVTIARGGRTDVFLRGSGGWLFESADQLLVDHGWVATAGGGVKYWWTDRTPRSTRRVGLRIEGRLRLHDTGVIADGRAIRLTPVLVGGVVFGL